MKDREIEWDGLAISKPGLYKDVPISRYHSANICVGPSISSSGLRKIWQCPAYYWDTSPYNPHRDEEDEEKPHYVLGRAMHHLAFGQALFDQEFAIQPDTMPDKVGFEKPWQGNRTECREWIAARRREGKSVLSYKDGVALHGMALAIQKHPMFKAGLLHGRVERSLFWRDKETGIWCKIRPDVIPTDSGDVADLKTTTSVALRDLVFTTFNAMHYHMQGALIRTGFREVLDLEMQSFSLLFVEKKRPHCTEVVHLKPHDLDMGEKQNRAALRQFAASMKSGFWAGPNGAESPGYIEASSDYRLRVEQNLQRLNEEFAR